MLICGWLHGRQWKCNKTRGGISIGKQVLYRLCISDMLNGRLQNPSWSSVTSSLGRGDRRTPDCLVPP
jgi:hypothetical protein